MNQTLENRNGFSRVEERIPSWGLTLNHNAISLHHIASHYKERYTSKLPFVPLMKLVDLLLNWFRTFLNGFNGKSIELDSTLQQTSYGNQTYFIVDSCGLKFQDKLLSPLQIPNHTQLL